MYNLQLSALSPKVIWSQQMVLPTVKNLRLGNTAVTLLITFSFVVAK
jgi:hypothetical protein